jgi:hypothetical protein
MPFMVALGLLAGGFLIVRDGWPLVLGAVLLVGRVSPVLALGLFIGWVLVGGFR